MQFIKIIFLLLISFVVSCQPAPTKPVTKQNYLSFDDGIQQLANGLLTKLQQRKSFLSTGISSVVMNPFLDIDTGQVLQVSLDIERLFIEETKHFEQLFVSRITPEKLVEAQYILNGTIKYKADKTLPGEKHYQISAAIVDLKTKTIVTNGTVWIASSGLNYQPTPSYEDNPIYLKGKLLKHTLRTVENPIGSLVDDDYYIFIATNALLVAAQTAYDKKNYELADRMFKEVTERSNGNIIEAYGGLYAVAFKTGDLEKAEENFSQMVAIGVENGSLPVKFLFQPHLTEFLDIPEIRQQYALWLRQISLYFKNNPDKCVEIIGHTSLYGIYENNKRLSKRRADKIQEVMRQTFPGIVQRSTTIGMGPDKTIVGTKPDSADNAIDRRVEFKIVDCVFSDQLSVISYQLSVISYKLSGVQT
jgi:outer membrane protein OmpA-like peptidoglycan-associated protein